MKNFPFSPDLPDTVTVKTFMKHVPEVNPAKHHYTYNQHLDQLQNGDVVVISSSYLWNTFAVVSNTKPGNEKMICFADSNNIPVTDIEALWKNAEVTLKEVDIELMTHKRFTIVKQDDESRFKTLMRAHDLRQKQRRWSFLEFNSEHFATHALTDKGESHQLANLKTHIKKSICEAFDVGLLLAKPFSY